MPMLINLVGLMLAGSVAMAASGGEDRAPLSKKPTAPGRVIRATSPAAIHPTWPEWQAEWEKLAQKENAGPTLLKVFETAKKDMKEPELEGKVTWGLFDPMVSPEDANDAKSMGGGMMVLGKLQAPDEEVRDDLKKFVDGNRPFLAQMRKGRPLPAGRLDVDLFGSQGFGSLTVLRTGVRYARYQVWIDVVEKKGEAAKEAAIDSLSFGRIARSHPGMLCRMVGAMVDGFSTQCVLLAARDGNLSAESIEEMAKAVDGAKWDVCPEVVQSFRFERAFSIEYMDRLERRDPEMMKALGGMIAMGEGKKPVVTIEDVIRDLPVDRENLVDLGVIEPMLRKPGMRVVDPEANESSMRIVLRRTVPVNWGWSDYQMMFLVAQTRMDATAGLLRAMAFKKKNGRWPKAAELAMPDDPFKPGQKLIFEYDEKGKRIGVYTTGWDEKQRRDGDPKRIGYWVVVE